MNSWIIESLDAAILNEVNTEFQRRLLKSTLNVEFSSDDDDMEYIADAYELAALDLLGDEDGDEDSERANLTRYASMAYKIYKVMNPPKETMDRAKYYLRASLLGVIGEQSIDVARLLRAVQWGELPVHSHNWGQQTLANALDIWLRLLRKNGWEDLHGVQQGIARLRDNQKTFERTYLEEGNEGEVHRKAWELVALYHASKAAEIVALYVTQGHVEHKFDPVLQVEAQIDRALKACDRGELVELRSLLAFTLSASRIIIRNSIWSLTRSVDSRLSRFITGLVNNESSPLFDLLPPQRIALREQGIASSGSRSVVVNMPTSSGKTFIAEFRILQALAQFEVDDGWVAYIAPTRALVNQITSRLRRDFSPLGIGVEKVSPALEVDGLEAEILQNRRDDRFRVLVTTPEKLDLLIRGGWETKVGRPLVLLVVDEAHNIGQSNRGLKLELLLSTINRESPKVSFLLLTPFISNAKYIARWLDPGSYKDIHLTVEWKPNDTAIVLCKPINTEGKKFEIELETLATPRETLNIPERIKMPCISDLGVTYNQVKNSSSKIAAVVSENMKWRGPVIILAGQVRWVWSLARTFVHPSIKKDSLHPDVALVQRYLASEFGEDFELIEMLNYGVGVHHSGLSDEAKALMEWLLENNRIEILVATTTIAQGVNFPVSAVVVAQNTYFEKGKGAVEMPPEDFWNIAGRAGRVHQGSVGIVALAAKDDEHAILLRNFAAKQLEHLASTLTSMLTEAINLNQTLRLEQLFYMPAWSAFLQYLAHLYRQYDNLQDFTNNAEQSLRGTLGFQTLRRNNPALADVLISSVINYGERISGKPLKLVDVTGFSWESVSIALGKISDSRIDEDIWKNPKLLSRDSADLPKLMGILLDVPELRENLSIAIGGEAPNGSKLARIVSDWVSGRSIPELAKEYYSPEGSSISDTEALSECCRSIFGRIAQTASWGLSALQALTLGDSLDNMPDAEQSYIRNLPAKVFYGVNSDEAVALRLLGIPRSAAFSIAQSARDTDFVANGRTISRLRDELRNFEGPLWSKAAIDNKSDYYRVWRIMEGSEK